MFCYVYKSLFILLGLFCINTVSFPSFLPVAKDLQYDTSKIISYLKLFSACTVHTVKILNQINPIFPNFCHSGLYTIHSQIVPSNLSLFNDDFWLQVNFDPANISYTQNKIFTHKHQLSCVAEIRLSVWIKKLHKVSEMLQLYLVQKGPTSLNKGIRSYQPDYVLLPTRMLSQNQHIFVNIPFKTRAVILLIDVDQSRLYFACAICVDKVEKNRGLDNSISITQPKLFIYKKQTFRISNLADIKTISAKINSNAANRFTKVKRNPGNGVICPFENNREKNMLTWYSVWITCAESMFQTRLNCTTSNCISGFIGIYHLDMSEVQPNQYIWSQGSEAYGVQYSLLYNPPSTKNLFALLSPFSVKGWIVMLLTCYFVGLVLWMSKIRINSFFWLFVVVLEQGDDIKSQLNKINTFVVISWIYGALMFRQAYTSNLFTYMTLEASPSDLPKTFEETLVSDSLICFATDYILYLLETFQNAVHNNNSASQTTLFELVDKALTKVWKIDSYTDALSNIRHTVNGNYEVCNLKLNMSSTFYDTDLESCREQSRLALFQVTGPADWYTTTISLTNKLLLKINNSRLQIFETYGKSYFQISRIVVSQTDSFLMRKMEEFLAYITQSGMQLLQLNYIQQRFMKSYVNNKYDYTSYKFSGSNIGNLVSLWTHNRCHIFYKPELCDLNLNEYLEVPVTFDALTVLWLLLMLLYVFCICSFTRELLIE